MNNQCPKCSGIAKITTGRFRDLTNARFDTDYTDGAYGMVHGVKIICPSCGELNLNQDTYHQILAGEIDAEEIGNFLAAFPGFKGVIPLATWLETRNDKDID